MTLVQRDGRNPPAGTEEHMITHTRTGRVTPTRNAQERSVQRQACTSRIQAFGSGGDLSGPLSRAFVAIRHDPAPAFGRAAAGF